MVQIKVAKPFLFFPGSGNKILLLQLTSLLQNKIKFFRILPVGLLMTTSPLFFPFLSHVPSLFYSQSYGWDHLKQYFFLATPESVAPSLQECWPPKKFKCAIVAISSIHIQFFPSGDNHLRLLLEIDQFHSMNNELSISVGISTS